MNAKIQKQLEMYLNRSFGRVAPAQLRFPSLFLPNCALLSSVWIYFSEQSESLKRLTEGMISGVIAAKV